MSQTADGRTTDGRERGGHSATATLAVAAATFIATIATMRLLQHAKRAARSRARQEELHAAELWQHSDSQLDEELDQTFPASDPLPFMHRID